MTPRSEQGKGKKKAGETKRPSKIGLAHSPNRFLVALPLYLTCNMEKSQQKKETEN